MRGSQEPRLKVEPERVTTDGPDAAMLMQAYANALDPWQQSVVDCWLGKDADGKYTVTSAGLALPRQNGKNVCLEARELIGLVINGEKILHTAHQVKTAKKSFNRFVRIFTDERYPEIMALVKRIRFTNGEESIELNNGAAIEYSARSRQAARGFDGISLVVYDEAQELTDDQVEAIMATLSASATGTRQVIYTGTPPYPNCPGTVFRRRRTASLNDPGKHDAWHEWSVDGKSIEDINISDHDLWYSTNPALGIRLDEDFTAEECKTMSADGFARERLGWWAPVLTEQTEFALNHEAWAQCASTEPKPTGKTAYGVRFTPDGSEVILAGAVIPAEGKPRVEVIERRPTAHGIRWLSEWLNQRYTTASAVVIDGRNGVDVLTDRINETWRAKNSIIRPTVREVVAAAGFFITAVNENNMSWYQEQTALNTSAITATKRPIAGGFGFGGADPGPVEACALALWGAHVSKRNPQKKMRIG